MVNLNVTWLGFVFGEGWWVCLKLDVEGQGGGKGLDVYEQGGRGGLEN